MLDDSGNPCLQSLFWIFFVKNCLCRRVAKVVAPKRESLKLAEDDLKREEDLLQIKRNELQEVTDKLQLLYDDLKEKQTKMKVRNIFVYNKRFKHIAEFDCM